MLGDLKIKNSIIWNVQLFYLMSYEKMLNWNWSLVSMIEKVFNLAISIDFMKRIELEKSQFGTKTQLLKHSLLGTSIDI